MDKFIGISIAKLVMNASGKYWGNIALGMLGDLVSGTGFPIEYQGVVEGQYLFCKVSDMNLGGNEKYIKYSVNTITDQIRAKIKAKIYPAGTVIFPKIGGAIATNKRRILNKEAAFDNNIMGIVPNAQVNPEWLYYCLQSIDFAVYQLGTSVPSLRGDTLSQLRVPNVPLREQEMIAQFLKWLEIKKGVVDWSIAPQFPNQLEDNRRIIMYINALADRIAEARGLRQQAVQEASEILSSYHLALSGSRKVKISDCLWLDERSEKVELGKAYPQVGVRGFGQGLFPKEAVDSTMTSYRAFNRLFTGAVVLSQVKGWEGAIGVCPLELDEWYVSPEYRTFSCIPGQAVPEYLALIVPTPWFWMKLKQLSRGLGGRRERVRPELFLDMEIEMPIIEQQLYAVRAFKQLDALKHLQAETAAEMDALLPAVLDRAFRGELL